MVQKEFMRALYITTDPNPFFGIFTIQLEPFSFIITSPAIVLHSPMHDIPIQYDTYMYMKNTGFHSCPLLYDIYFIILTKKPNELAVIPFAVTLKELIS